MRLARPACDAVVRALADGLYYARFWDSGHGEAVAPRHAPAKWLGEYTMRGRVPMVDLYVDERRCACVHSRGSVRAFPPD